MKLVNLIPYLCIGLVSLTSVNAQADMQMDTDMNMNMDSNTTPTSTNEVSDINWETVIPAPWPKGHHGVPILNTTLTPEQRKYWESYNTTTYFSIETPYHNYLIIHLILLSLSAWVLYPFVLIFNNLESNWYLPSLTIQATVSILSCITFTIFINNVPDLYPNMAYSKMITGLFVFTILQYTFSVFNAISRWTNSNNSMSHKSFTAIPEDPEDVLSEENGAFVLEELHSPAATLYDDDDSDMERSMNKKSKITQKRDSILSKLSNIPFLSNLNSSFGIIFTILHNLATWGLFAYFLVLFPTAAACLNLLGQGNKVFNLLAHFIKGGVFITLGIVSLARYCGCFQQMGGAWNYAYVGSHERQSGQVGIFLRSQRPGSCITSFEMIESCLILFYGSTNVFLEHLSNPGGGWAAKDLQHVSIAFMYFGSGLCGVITELKLSNWRKGIFFSNLKGDLPQNENENKLAVTPGFSPNPFPVFTIFWTGLLMSKHSQESALSTDIHVQWGSLLTYGSFFRIFTFLWMSYCPTKGASLLLPGKPLTELITSFCLLCGGLVFMESTDPIINALAYRGFTPMFTINVSVGIISLVVAWIMTIFAIKDYLKRKLNQ